MPGFFPDDEYKTAGKGKRRSCLSCGLSGDCFTPKMKPLGKGTIPILHVVESYSEQEDKKNSLLEGKAGKYYNRISKSFGYDVHNGLKTGVLQCHSPSTTSDQIACCRVRLFETIKNFQPKLIMLLGEKTIDSYFGERITKKLGGINKWRGWVVPDFDNNCWVAPIYNPEVVLDRAKWLPSAEMVFKSDIERALEKVDEPLPKYIDIKSSICLLDNQNKIKKWLKKILKKKPKRLAFDYETTGIKPDLKGHKIHCVSLCWKDNLSIAFSTLNWSKKNKKLFLKILADPEIGKIAQNMKFEDKWTNTIFKSPVNNWDFDPMIASHIEDNRRGITGLKFQCRIKYGIWEYDNDVAHLLKGEGVKGSNNFNQIHKIPVKKLLKYCAIDSLIEYRLADDLRKTIL